MSNFQISRIFHVSGTYSEYAVHKVNPPYFMSCTFRKICENRYVSVHNKQISVCASSNLRLCMQMAAGACKFASVWLCHHSTSAFFKPNIQAPSAEYWEACVDDVDLPMLQKYNYDVKTAFLHTSCLLVSCLVPEWPPVACKLYPRGRQQWWANLDQASKDLDKTIFRDLLSTPIP
jgi:hypothetical protein